MILLSMIAALSQVAAPRPAPASTVQAESTAQSVVEAALTEAFRSALELQFTTCEDDAVKARLSGAFARLSSLQPMVAAQIGGERSARLISAMVVDTENLYTPGCPPKDELDRRIARFEERLGRLETALRAQ